jgi:excisionase family DNA binding protein
MAQHRPEITGRKLPGTSMNRPIGDRLVYTVPEAGRLLGLGRNAAYEAAKRGDIPTIRMGRLLRVPKGPFHKLVGAEVPPKADDVNLSGEQSFKESE